jgi:hypothetical protein
MSRGRRGQVRAEPSIRAANLKRPNRTEHSRVMRKRASAR